MSSNLDTITSCTVDFSRVSNLLKIFSSKIYLGLVIDFVGRKIYWTDETLKTIEVSELDGRNRMVLFTVNVDVPRGIALDPFIR